MNAYSQQPIKNYDAEWKKVQGFMDKNLPKSALTEVKNIYTLAKKEKQDAQIIKSLLFISNLQQETREENEAFSVAEIEKELAESKEPAASILNSLLAGMYWQYFQNNRWKLYDRTQTSSFKKEDIATWGVEDFHSRITSLYLASIANEKILQQTELKPFDALIEKGNMRHLRPTLYDLLAHKALGYFQTDERDINKPAYAFEINQAAAFDPAADFVTRQFNTKDSASLQHKALLLYQRLIAFHLRDTKPDALIDVDLQRIGFVKQKSVHPDKERLYFDAINHIARQYETLPAAAQAWYLLAVWHNQKGESYKPYGDSTYRLDKIKARDICQKIVAQKDSSEGKINCQSLLAQLNRTELRFTVEKVNLPDQPFRSLVSYRNTSQVYLRLVKADANIKNLLEDQYGDKYWSPILAAAPVRSWQQALPNPQDLQDHTAEIKIDGLPAGDYILLIGTDKDFNSKKTVLGARLFYVSTISFTNTAKDYFVLNRDNGQPLADATVQAWEKKYDYTTYKYVRQKAKLYKTDANGFFRMEKPPKTNTNRYSNYSYQLDITYKKDRLFMDDMISDYYYYRDAEDADPKDVRSVFLFTDRSIYRPGQTLYAKGIALVTTAKEKKASILTNFETTVYLRDANYQQIDSVKVKTNDYGSFSAKFQLPASGLNGRFSLLVKNDLGSAAFRVEEYKRPKFYVDYDTLKGTYRVNDNIKITGFAKAYAGNNIDGASVKYRVVRQPRFIYPWLFKRWYLPQSTEMEITNGEVKTGSDGKFTIEFTAIPDLTIDKKFDPVFDYRVYADVTDINGETRSGEQTVSVSYKSLLLKTYIPELLPADSLKSLSIRTENMNGQLEPTTVKVIIRRLQEEKRLIRERYWERPDQFVMAKDEYIKNFPYDEYNNETDKESWAKGPAVFEKVDSVKAGAAFPVKAAFQPGYYVIEIVTHDKTGQEVKDVKYIELYNAQKPQFNAPQYLWTEAGKTIEPGEKTAIKLGSAADKLFVVQSEDKSAGSYYDDPQNVYKFLQLNNETRSFEFSATETDRGGYGVGWMFVKHNRVYQYNQTINVPWSNKNLAVQYATYRDKTLPGSEEKWKIKISGYKNEKVAAEMLASMYDASLDQFYPHGWNTPSVWPGYYNRNNWNGTANFAKIESMQRPIEYKQQKWVNKTYDRFLFDGYNTINIGYGNVRMMNAAAPVMLESKVSGIAEDAAKPAARKRAENEAADSDGIIANKIVQQGEMYVHAEKGKKTADAQVQGQGPEVQVRKNFNETAFFLPDLKTDADGNIEFSFTMPEALTKWKFQSLAHTKDLAFGYSSKEIVTQKDLMVQPNPTRFLREGDKMEFSAKIVNLSDKELTGTAEFQLIDARTNERVDGRFKNVIPNQFFTVAAGQSEAVKFPIEVPYQYNEALVWRIVAKAGTFSDGEENMLPVLTNRMLVTESMPLPVRGRGTKNFTFTKLLNSDKSETLQHYALTTEYTSNPAWYAVQALPYLMEYPYECAEQTWNRYYANSLASFISNSSPRIKQVFEQWKIKDTAALLSNLQKNQELKAVLLEETPWVLQAKSEAEQKRNIALLFDMVTMSNQLNGSFEKLKQMQSPNGGFVWFTGGPDDRYITQYIITGIGHLQKLKGIAKGQEDKLAQLIDGAIPYLDRKIKEDYDDLIKYKTDLTKYTPGYAQVQYLYMRSFFPQSPVAAASKKAYDYFRSRAILTWTQQNKYMQGMLVLALGRTGDAKTPAAILKSLKETSINNEELGMYWKDAGRSWWWYEAPVERQALLIEAFQEIGKDTKTVDDLRTWLLKNKQTNRWESTKATAEACYALLLQGTEWLATEPVVQIKLGATTISSTDNEQEAGTGYFKKTIEGTAVRPSMGNISVTVTTPSAAYTDTQSSWGSVYWQYFEDLDKITVAATLLKLEKKLFVERNSDRGPVLTPVKDGDVLKVGDKIKVRIELRVDRDMEYVHMKDMRASALEPVNVLSSYKWQGGLGYYETTKDASTNFFFGDLRKGTYVFEYPLFVTHAGNFSNGITSIQCMYAPEFTAHSEGVRITVE